MGGDCEGGKNILPMNDCFGGFSDEATAPAWVDFDEEPDLKAAYDDV